MPALGDFAPKLLHTVYFEDMVVLVLTAIRGKTINEAAIVDTMVLENAYYSVGELLRTLHNQFHGDYYGTPSIDGTSFGTLSLDGSHSENQKLMRMPTYSSLLRVF
jgi:hypothetical protein